MSTRNFRQMLEAKWDEGKFVCVGLDPDWDKIPQCVKTRAAAATGPGYSAPVKTLIEFCTAIVSETKDIVCAYKLNSAFFEAFSHKGLYALDDIIRYILVVAPDVPVILDAKRGDIGNSNAGYVRGAFSMLHADAITVHPYLGQEALQPFLDQKDKGIIILCRTSNKGAGEFQDRLAEITPDELSDLHLQQVAKSYDGLSDDGPATFKVSHHFAKNYQIVAGRVAYKWNGNNNCLLVAGATYPQELAEIRQIVGDMPILIPGIGAQGGDLEAMVSAGKDSRGRGTIINSSRGIIFASSGVDFAEAARRETLKLHEAITQCLEKGAVQV